MRRTQVSGHGLLAEGAPFEFEPSPDPESDALELTRRHGMGVSGQGRAVCSCGAYSESLPTAAARRRWHNEHKAEAKR